MSIFVHPCRAFEPNHSALTNSLFVTDQTNINKQTDRTHCRTRKNTINAVFGFPDGILTKNCFEHGRTTFRNVISHSFHPASNSCCIQSIDVFLHSISLILYSFYLLRPIPAYFESLFIYNHRRDKTRCFDKSCYLNRFLNQNQSSHLVNLSILRMLSF